MLERFEWDETKNRLNRSKHGVSFEEASMIFDGPVLSAIDDREDYGEERFIGYGQIEEAVVVAVVYSVRHRRTRLIAARMASRRETRDYYGHLQETT